MNFNTVILLFVILDQLIFLWYLDKIYSFTRNRDKKEVERLTKKLKQSTSELDKVIKENS